MRRLAATRLSTLVVAGLAAVATMAGHVLARPVSAQERILSYDIDVGIRADGSLDVMERITVRAEGDQIRRGIYRDFPTRYRDRYGNLVRVGFEVLGVERDGRPEPWFTERRGNGIRINTGDDDFLPMPADHTFVLRYRTTRQLGFFQEHDELYWNAIGTGWVFPIETGTVRVRLPQAVAVDRLGAEAYTGTQGAAGADYTAELIAPGVAEYRLTRTLARREGLTVALTFPKGVVAEPGNVQRAWWLFADNRGALIGLAGLALLLFYCVRQWLRIGRDPPRGVIIPRYRPGDGRTPAGLRYLQRMGYDARCFSSEVLSLAVAGHLRIARNKRLLKDEWRLERSDRPPAGPSAPSQEALLKRLFPTGKSTLELKKANATTLSAARRAHEKALDREFHPRYFRRNLTSVSLAAIMAVVPAVAGFGTSNGHGIPMLVTIAVVMLLTVAVFAWLVRAPTAEGRRLLDEIEGLKLYLSVAERDELALLRAPDGPPVLDVARYEALLPFAVALGVEDAWTRKFTAAVGPAAAAAATSGMIWYSGTVPVSNLSDFSRSLGSTLSSQISSASSPPGSSSGSGGGGSVGGGGGGGGGGGR